MQSQKKEKGSSRRIYSCFFTHNGITTPKTTREGQESTTKTSLHLVWPPKFKNQVLFTPRAQSRFLDLGLLLRGCRPKSRSLPGRVEVIQPVVRACTTFWLTSTRITLTRVHRQRPADTYICTPLPVTGKVSSHPNLQQYLCFPSSASTITISEYFSNAPTATKAGRMPATPTVACTPPNPCACDMIFGFYQSARKGVDMSDAITN